MLKEIEERNAAKAPAKPEKPKEEQIKIDDFAKISLRAAKVLSCEPLKTATSCLFCRWTTDLKQNRFFRGIAQSYKPEELVGKTVALVDNLAPRKAAR